MRVAIAGAGVFGLTAALELRRRGHAVTVCDPGPVPHPLAESTDISKVVRMDYADPFYVALMEETFAAWEEWNDRWGERLFRQVGFLLLTRAPMRPATLEHDAFAQVTARGHLVERLDASAIAARFPAFAGARYADGYLNPRAGFVDSGRVIELLARDARAAGVELRSDAGASALLEEGGRIAGLVIGAGATVRADAVLVAAGSWTPLLVPQLRDRLWSTGQTVLHLLPRDPQSFRPPRFPVWAADIGSEGWYGFPARADGVVKVANHGAGRPLHPDADRVVLAGDETRFRAFLATALPELARAPVVGSRLCLYSDSWDGDFYIDRDPDWPGLTVAAGGSGHAFKFAPSLGAIIADAVEGRDNRWGGRFRWRARAAESGARR